MSKWNIDKHIKEHADYYFNKLTGEVIENGTYLDEEINENYTTYDTENFFTNRNNFIHFVVSFNLIDFENGQEAKELLTLLLKKLKNYEIVVKEKNGFRKNKNGTKVQKYRNRKIKIGEWLLAGAIHTQGFDEKWIVNPHLHLIFDKKAKLGKSFSYIKKAILDIKKELGIKQKTSFEEKSTNISRKFKSVMNVRSWAIRQGKNLQKKTFELFEKDVIKYLEKSNNLEFALKSFLLLEEKGKAYNFYPYFLENKIKEFIYDYIDYSLHSEAILKLLAKEKYYKDRTSPFKYFVIEKMNFTEEEFDKLKNPSVIEPEELIAMSIYKKEKEKIDNPILTTRANKVIRKTLILKQDEYEECEEEIQIQEFKDFDTEKIQKYLIEYVKDINLLNNKKTQYIKKLSEFIKLAGVNIENVELVIDKIISASEFLSSILNLKKRETTRDIINSNFKYFDSKEELIRFIHIYNNTKHFTNASYEELGNIIDFALVKKEDKLRLLEKKSKEELLKENVYFVFSLNEYLRPIVIRDIYPLNLSQTQSQSKGISR